MRPLLESLSKHDGQDLSITGATFISLRDGQYTDNILRSKFNFY